MTPFRGRKVKGQGHQDAQRRDRKSAISSGTGTGRPASHHLQGAEAYSGGRTTVGTACLCSVTVKCRTNKVTEGHCCWYHLPGYGIFWVWFLVYTKTFSIKPQFALKTHQPKRQTIQHTTVYTRTELPSPMQTSQCGGSRTQEAQTCCKPKAAASQK